jgi:hypothetical protein
MTGVIMNLAESGYLAYSSTTNMNFAQIMQLQETSTNVPIANVSEVVINDSVYALQHRLNELGGGQTASITDGYSRLMSQGIARAQKALSSGSVVDVEDAGVWRETIRSALNNHHVRWVGALTDVLDSSKLAAMSAVYFGSGVLEDVVIRDTVANLSQIASHQVAGLTNFVQFHSNNSLVVDVADTVNNIYTALTGSNATSFKSQIETVFSGNNLESRIMIQDSVANIKAAYDSGRIGMMEAAANSFLSSNNSGLTVRVRDTATNIDAFINSGTYSALVAKTTSYIVIDNASNLINAFNEGWANSVSLASNIFVKDTYANISEYSADLFNGYSNGIQATRAIITNLIGANVSNPLIIEDMDSDGIFPQLDFTLAGLTGDIAILQSKMDSIPSGYAQTNGIGLNIYHSGGQNIAINILNYYRDGNGNNIDPTGVSIENLLLPTSSGFTNYSFSFSSGDIGLPTDHNYASIYNFNAGDRITYSSGVMSIVGNSAPATTGKASINLSTGIASFYPTDVTLAEQLSAVERAISDANIHSNGHMAMWANGSDTFMLITDDRNGVTDGDALIRIVDTQPNQLHYDPTQYVVLA